MEKNGWGWKWPVLTIAIILFLLVVLTRCFSPSEKTAITYKDFLEKLERAEIILVGIEENGDQTSGIIIEVRAKNGNAYRADFPLYLHPGLIEKLEEAGVEILRIQPSSFSWGILFWIFIPLLLIFLFINMGKSQVNGVKSMVQDHEKLAGHVKERFSDVAGIDEEKEELLDIVDFLSDPEKYRKLGARIPRGALLSGAPGTGKTLLAKAVAGEAGVPFWSISASEFVEMFVGVGAARVRNLFKKARKTAPCIIFIDEIDAVGRHRGSGLGHSHDEREQTLNQILAEMDGFDERTNVIVLAATNRYDILDPALLRPGRFDRKIVVNKPDVKGREAILKVHTIDKPLADDVNLENIAKSLPGATGADLANIVNESAIVAAKRGESKINNFCFLAAVDKILMGKEKKLVMTKKDKELIAYHEAGHVAVSKALPEADPVRKVSIIARERSLGQTLSLPEHDRYIVSEQYLSDFIKICLGGRLSEEIFLQTKSTGAENDLRIATDTAQKMVCSYGMSKLGSRAFGVKEEEIFLGREVTKKEDVSPSTLRKIDEEVKRLIDEAYNSAKDKILQNKAKVEALVKALLEKETLEREEIDAIWEGKPI